MGMMGLRKILSVLLVLLVSGCMYPTVFDYQVFQVKRVLAPQGERFIAATVYTDDPGSFAEAKTVLLYPNLALASNASFAESIYNNVLLYDLAVTDADSDGKPEIFACGSADSGSKIQVLKLHTNDTFETITDYVNDNKDLCTAIQVYENHVAAAVFGGDDNNTLHHLDFNGTELSNLTAAEILGFGTTPVSIFPSIKTTEVNGERLFVVGGTVADVSAPGDIRAYLGLWNFTSTDGWTEKKNITFQFNGDFTIIMSVDLFDINNDAELEILASGTIFYDRDPGVMTSGLAKRAGFVSIYNLDDLSEITNYTTYAPDTVVLNQIQGVNNSGLKEIMVTGWERNIPTAMADKVLGGGINQTWGIVQFYMYYPTNEIALVDEYKTRLNSSLWATEFVDPNHIYSVGSGVDYNNFWIKKLKQTSQRKSTECNPFSGNLQSVNITFRPYLSGSTIAYAKDSCSRESGTTPLSFTVS